METRTLGGGLTVSAVGLGCMGFSHAYGAPMERGEAVRRIREAVEMGYTFFDTAEVYGTPEDPHANESLVGEALAPFRGKVAVATKFGLRFDFASGKVPLPLLPDSRPASIRQAVEGSLRRLRAERIDLYFSTASTRPCRPRRSPGRWRTSSARERSRAGAFLRRMRRTCAARTRSAR